MLESYLVLHLTCPYSFLYMLFLCMDANFRLKNQIVSNYSQHPGLGIGWAYMVPRVLYGQYVLSHASDSDVSIILVSLSGVN